MPSSGIYLSTDRLQQLNGDLFEQDSRGVIADTFQQQATAALPDLVAEAQRQADQQAQAQRNQMADQFLASVQVDPGLAAHLGGSAAPTDTTLPMGGDPTATAPNDLQLPTSGMPTSAGPATPPAVSDVAAPPAPPSTPLPAPDTPVTAPMSPASGWETVARAAAQKYGIDPDIFSRQIGQESGFNPAARSPAGAIGIAQFMPATAQDMGIDPTDPSQALDGAARLMAQNLQKYGGDYSKALAAYNAGPGNVDKYGGVPPFEETQRYVANILGGAGKAAAGAVQAVQTAVRDPGSILDAVKPFLGQAYVWGGKGPQQGFDCSGLAGFLTTGQPESTGTLYGKSSAVGQAEAQPGDLVFWNMGTSDPHLQHVGVYLGNGQIVQSGGNQAKVNIGSVDQAIGSPPEFRRLGPGGAPAQSAVAPAQAGPADQAMASTSAPQGILDKLQQIGPTISSAISDAFSNLFSNLGPGAGMLAQGQEAQGRGLTQAADLTAQTAAGALQAAGNDPNAGPIGLTRGAVQGLVQPLAGELADSGLNAARQQYFPDITEPGHPLNPATPLDENAAIMLGGMVSPMAVQGMSRFYHGTGSDFARPDAAKFDANGLFGPGYYLTDSPVVAGGLGDVLPADRRSMGYAQTRGSTGLDPNARAMLQSNIDEAQRIIREDNPDPSFRTELQQTIREFQDQLDAQVPGIGANVRAVDVPQNLNLLNVDAPLTSDARSALQEVLTQMRDSSDSRGRQLARVVHDDVGPGATGQDLYNALEGTGGAKFANDVLAWAGFDGIQYGGGKRIPMQDAAGRNIEHTAINVFPSSLDKLRNAISGTQGGQVGPQFATTLGGAAAGGGTAAANTDENDPDRILKIAGGALAGGVAGYGAGRLLGSPAGAAFLRDTSGELRFPEDNPFALHTEPGPGRVPLGEDDIAAHLESLGAQYEANDARIQELENQIHGGSLKPGASGVQRPPWAAGITNDVLRQIAADHGVQATTERWWEHAGLLSGSGEVRENVRQGGYTGLGRTQQTPAQARAELQRLIAENDQIMAATEVPEGAATLYRPAAQTAEDLPWTPYTQPAEVATSAPTGIPAQAVSAGADQGGAGASQAFAPGSAQATAALPAEVAQPLSLTPVTPRQTSPPPPTPPVGEPHGLTINLPKYVPEEVRGIIQQAYDAHPEIMDAARRGVIPDDVVRELAAQTGTNAGRIANLWKPGQAKNAETILALRQSLADQSQQVLTAQQAVKAAPTSFDAQRQLVQALTRHAAVQEVVTGVTAEAGRALRQFRQPIEGANQTIESLQALAKRWKVSPEEFGAAIARVDLSDPVAVAGVARSLVHHTPADYLSSLWYFNLLSSPLSHVRNVVSNSVVAAVAPLEAVPSAAFDVARTAISGAPRERFFGETAAQYVGFGAGMREGMVNGLQILAHGFSDAQAAGQLAGTRAAQEAFSGPLGMVINAPGRALGAEDAFFRTMNKTGSLYSQAYRLASQEGLKGQALIDRVTELRRAPLPDMLKEAESVGAFRIFQEDSELANKLRGLPAWSRFFVPFIKTPINIVKYAMQYSPVGFGTLGYDAARGAAGTAGQVEDRLARASMGTAILGGLSLWAQDGNLTGAPPDTPTERDAFLREHPAYSMKIGNEWYSYQALQPFSSLFAAVAAIHQSQEKGMRLEPAAAGTLVAFSIAKSITDMPWLQGLTQALDAQHNPQQMAGAYTESVARSLAFPTAFWGFVNRATDNMLRSPQNPGQAWAGQFPGFTGVQPTRLNAFGQEVQRPPEQMGILGALNPFNPAPVKDDPVDKALADLQLHGYTVEPGFVGKQQTVPKLGVAVDLTNDENRQVQKVSGQLAYSILLPVVTNPAWAKLTPEARAKIVDDVISKSRDYARKQLLPELIPRGIAAFNQEYASGIRKPAPKPAGVP